LANIARQYPHLILLEAFHYRFHPASLAFHALVNSNKYGIVRRVEANFCAPDFFPAGDIRFNLELAGGGAMDMGAYTMNGLRWLLNSEPNRVIESKATELPNKPGIDKTLDVKFEFPALDGQGEPRIGHASLGWNMKFTSWIPYFIAETDSHILTYRNFLAPSVRHSLRVTDKKTGKLVEVKNVYGETGYLTYTYQLQAFVNKVKSNICDPISWRNIDDVPGNMRAIDMAYTAAGMEVRK
jgi:predicted dehydrogenase